MYLLDYENNNYFSWSLSIAGGCLPFQVKPSGVVAPTPQILYLALFSLTWNLLIYSCFFCI